MANNGVLNNAWFKLAVVSLVGIVLIFGVLWGINEFNRNYGYGNMNMGNGYHYGMQQGYHNQMNGNMQGGMNMGGNMQGGMGMMGGMGMH